MTKVVDIACDDIVNLHFLRADDLESVFKVRGSLRSGGNQKIFLAFSDYTEMHGQKMYQLEARFG